MVAVGGLPSVVKFAVYKVGEHELRMLSAPSRAEMLRAAKQTNSLSGMTVTGERMSSACAFSEAAVPIA
jgi:hypothetical protein